MEQLLFPGEGTLIFFLISFGLPIDIINDRPLILVKHNREVSFHTTLTIASNSQC